MRSWLVALLAIFVALQFSWSAVAAYDRHEPIPEGGTHFGHHASAVHDANAGKSPIADHGHCHLVTSAAPLPSEGVEVRVPCPHFALPEYLTPLRIGLAAPEIERPKWLRA